MPVDDLITLLAWQTVHHLLPVLASPADVAPVALFRASLSPRCRSAASDLCLYAAVLCRARGPWSGARLNVPKVTGGTAD